MLLNSDRLPPAQIVPKSARGRSRSVCARICIARTNCSREDAQARFFNQDVELYAPFAYDAALAMFKAIHDADSLDRAKIAAAFPKVTVTGVTGKIAFDPQGDLIKPPYTLFEVQQGQWKSQRTIGGNGV